MPSTRIKEKLSTLIPSQLPEFIRSDYTTFVSFLEAYYEYLEQDSYAQELLQNSRKYADIDLTVSSFVDYFVNQYINLIPKTVSADKKLLVKNIKDLYNSKGSKKSYDLLFRILFNKNVDIFYPSTQILKASDGKWKQRTSIFMETITGDPNILINKTALIKTTSSLFPFVVENVGDAFNTQGKVLNVKELFFTNDRNLPLNVGNEIEYENFKGRIVSIPNKVTIINAGTGFKVGDILPLTSGTGTGAKVKVSKVTATGGIRNVQFISYGYGYDTSFYNFFTAQQGIPEKTNVIGFGFTGGELTLEEQTPGFVDFGNITKPSYAENYFLQDYEGEVLRSFFTNTSTNTENNGILGAISVSTGASTDAALYVELGGLAKYPGYYESIDGFLSDEVFLENESYYQTFNYVLKIDERLKEYKSAVLDLLHPAGTRLLGELALNNDFNLGTELTAQLRLLISRFQEVFLLEENISRNFEKPVTDSYSTPEVVGKHPSKPILDIIDSILDNSVNVPLLRKLDDASTEISIPTKGFSKTLGDPGGPYALTYFAEEYTVVTEFVQIIDDFIILFDGSINMDTDYLGLFESGYVLNTNFAIDYTGSSEDYAGDVALIS